MRTICIVAMMVPASALKLNAAGGDVCTCLAWKDVYANYNMTCANLGENLCGGFFMHMSGNLCVNQGVGAGDLTKQACYVSSACQQLNGGKQESDQLARKFCTEADDRLMDKTPAEIGALCAKDDMDRGLVVKMAYATPGQTKWNAAKAYFTTGSANLTADETQELAAVQESGIRTVIDSKDGKPPFGLVDGSKVYEVSMEIFYFLTSLKSNRSIFEHPGQLTKMTCVSGC